MCPHFYRLQKIFDENRAEVVEILDSNSSFDDCYGYNDEFEETFDNQCEFKLFENNNNEAANVHCEQIVDDTKTNADLSHAEEAEKCETMQISTHFTSVPVNVLNEQTNEDIEFVETAPPIVDTIDLRSIAKKIKKEKIRKSLAALTQSQVDKNEMQKLRFKFEEYKFAQEFEFIKYKFEAEVELKKQELELREREMESNQRLRILEIESNQNLKTMEMEKNERVAKYELNLKYNALHKNTCNKNSD
ncbi:unnamed protein product [Ceratitis capitata]|nr:unnamed protein product [Ceratitis capitata]